MDIYRNDRMLNKFLSSLSSFFSYLTPFLLISAHGGELPVLAASEIRAPLHPLLNPDTPLPEVKDAHRIPRVLYLTYSDYQKVPLKVWQRLDEMAPEYDIQFYDDTACIDFLSKYFKSEVVKRFNSLVLGAHKADLFRYCLLYVYGGVYFDIKIKPDVPLHQMFDHERTDIFYGVVSYYGRLFQGVLATYPRNEIFLTLLDHIMATSDDLVATSYSIFTAHFRDILQHMLGYTLVSGEHFLNSQLGSIILFKELNQRENNETEDRKKGFYGIYTNEAGLIRLMKTRYSDFPW